MADDTIALDPHTLTAIVDKAHNGTPLFGVTSFQELEELQRAEESAGEVQSLTEQFTMIVRNIAQDDTLPDKNGALNFVVDEYMKRVELAMNRTQSKSLVERVRGWLKPDDESKSTDPADDMLETADFAIWKDATGVMRWKAVYSNNYRDDDNPPEIIAEESHKFFVEAVDKGIAKHPELWLWHIPGSRVGVADLVSYDKGFAHATGTIDKGMESGIEHLLKEYDIALSHGMPRRWIVRDANDPSVITRHITSEISLLPRGAAANKMTGFQILTESKSMSGFTEEQKQFLLDAGFEESKIASFDDSAKERDRKEKAEEQPEAEAVDVTEEPADIDQADEAKDAEQPESPQFATQDEVAIVLADMLQPLAEAVTDIRERMGAMEAEVKELRATDAEKIAAKAAMTPRASLADLVAASIVGRQEAVIDGRSSLAKDGPKETKRAHQVTGVGFLDQLINNTQEA